MEVWKPIPDYEDSYEVSNYGQVRSKDRYTPTRNGEVFKKGVIKTLKEDKDGYFKVCLSKNSKKKSFFVHRLVALTFIENPNNYPVVNHKDGNKQNNKVENLEWCTRSENDKHAYRIGLRKVTDGGTSKEVVQLDKETLKVLFEYPSISEASKQTGISVQMISYCCNGKCKTAGGFVWRFKEKV